MITLSWKYQNYSFSFDIWLYVGADTEVLIKHYLVCLKYFGQKSVLFFLNRLKTSNNDIVTKKGLIYILIQKKCHVIVWSFEDVFFLWGNEIGFSKT